MFSTNGKITIMQILFPVSLLAFVVFIMMAFQTMQILRDREALHNAKLQQEKPIEEAQRVQAQLNALAGGTLQLAQKGDKDAQAIIDRMKQLGITVQANKPASGAPAQAAPKGPAKGKP